MSEILGGRQVFSLSEVALSIQRTLNQRYTSTFWVRAEMNKLNFYRHSGHCYPELLEKKEGKVVAQMRGIIWKNNYVRINKLFLETLQEPLREGIKILFLARIAFDPVHGLSLIVEDIDPVFTLGDLEAEKQETIRRLQAENLFYNNKQLPFPLLPQRLAIISVETSKGYADFLKILKASPYGRVIFHKLFPAILQGEKAVAQILYRLNQIERLARHFDAVLILRGGGGEVGLSIFNSYELSKAVATFPLPVLTGIGHATNITVVEQVAHFNGITPTEVAKFLVEKFVSYDQALKHAVDVIEKEAIQIIQIQNGLLKSFNRLVTSLVLARLTETQSNLQEKIQSVQHHSRHLLSENKHLIRFSADALRLAIRDIKKNNSHNLMQIIFLLSSRTHQILGQWNHQLHTNQMTIGYLLQHKLNIYRLELEGLEKNVQFLDPVNVLKRGYSITLHHGKALKSPEAVKVGDQLTTRLAEGSLISIVHDINNSL
jgi:exodeoxyribonuclease VII large subunit